MDPSANHEAWPDPWQMIFIALCALILCSCRGPAAERSQLASQQQYQTRARVLSEGMPAYVPSTVVAASATVPAEDAKATGPVNGLLQEGTGSEPTGPNDAKNGRREASIPLVQQTAKSLHATQTPRIPREPQTLCDEMGMPLPYAPREAWSAPGVRQPTHEDEYLRDGGDEGLPAGVTRQRQVLGLGMEDAVASYDTLDGRTLVEPSNKVHIYAPRFGAVRQVVGLLANEERQRTGGISVPLKIDAPTTTQLVGNTKQNVQADDKISARPPVAMRSEQKKDVLSTTLGPRGFQSAFRAFENLSIIRLGVFEGAEKAMLARGSTAAIAWSHNQAVQIILERRGAMAEVKYDASQSVYTVTSPPGRPKLRLVKVASTPFAQPGDVVDFTLRFDNTGNEPIGNVMILDSLNTRLEYLPESAQCSREARFSVKPNEGGSVVLACELSAPLEPNQGGVLRFSCRVR
jgi:uncharacterized repeat protein (TIGR01451 family)